MRGANFNGQRNENNRKKNGKKSNSTKMIGWQGKRILILLCKTMIHSVAWKTFWIKTVCSHAPNSMVAVQCCQWFSSFWGRRKGCSSKGRGVHGNCICILKGEYEDPFLRVLADFNETLHVEKTFIKRSTLFVQKAVGTAFWWSCWFFWMVCNTELNSEEGGLKTGELPLFLPYNETLRIFLCFKFGDRLF